MSARFVSGRGRAHDGIRAVQSHATNTHQNPPTEEETS